MSAPDSVTEARVLDYLNGRLPVATPELLAYGEYENGWRYVLMSQLPGTELAAAWPAIPRPHQGRVVGEAGEMLAALHGLDPEPLQGILGPTDWAGFLAGQRATAPERQREVKLPDLWLSQIEGFLESVPLTPGREQVLLHTEVIREHLLVNPGTAGLELIGHRCRCGPAGPPGSARRPGQLAVRAGRPRRGRGRRFPTRLPRRRPGWCRGR